MAIRFERCDPRRLDLLLHHRLSAAEQRDLETHLLVCSACRTKLDELAGGARWWTEVRRYLGGDGAAESLRTGYSGLAADSGAVDLSFLQPSNHPSSLGRLGDYEILEVLGQGGMGVVLKAFDPSLHRPVAIKVLAANFAANGAARKRFAREAQAAAAVSHDHVVAVYAVDAASVPPYLVMALIAGQSLQERIDRSGPLELKEILRIGMQTASGLAAAHAQGLVHRDIKPANIMLENGIERVRITDFGLARAVDDASVSMSGAVAGTPQYMAPEQARGESVDQRADLFSLGSTLYAMCTGRAPFRGDSTLAIIRQVCDIDPPSIRDLNPDVPAWLTGVVRRLHEKDPAQRLGSAAELADLLERCLAHVQQPDRQPLPPLAQELAAQVFEPVPPPNRRPFRLAVALAAALLIAGGSIWWYWPRDVPTSPDARPDVGSLLDFSREDQTIERLRAKAASLEQSFLQGSVAEDLHGETVTQGLAARAARIQHNLSSPSETGLDPLASQMAGVRQKLIRLDEQLGASNR
jgi:serine/threonine protein kinase